MPAIAKVFAREILDSRGYPTVEVDLMLADGSFGRAAVPAGASTGSHEAVELRDGGSRYGGRGVQQAVANVNGELAAALAGHEFDQAALDGAIIALDATPDKRRLGANALLGISLAFARATAVSQHLPLYGHFARLAGNGDPAELPVPMMNILNGGAHTNWQSTDIQEFMVVPIGAPNFHEALRWGAETFHALGQLLAKRGLSTLVGDEGGYAPKLATNEAAIELLLAAITVAGYRPGVDLAIAIDAAASEFFQNGRYNLKSEGRTLTADDLIATYQRWVGSYPIISIEDGLAEDDWEGTARLTAALGSSVRIVGDDLFATNLERLRRGLAARAGNAILLKLNQAGTVTETLAVATAAQSAGYATIVSHRSGETGDPTIADLAVGLGHDWIKAGSVGRSEHLAKYNRLLRIEEELGASARFSGRSGRAGR